VSVNGTKISEIDHGYVILLGIYQSDTLDDVQNFVEKIINLRIMQDGDKMNHSILDTKGEILLISQFTLCADLTYGRRPSFHKAMNPQGAEVLYHEAVELFEKAGISVKTGQFGHYMDVEIQNDGPVTIVLDTH
jgi:D-tyrosyl-tRNA(Tyr) deacylase